MPRIFSAVLIILLSVTCLMINPLSARAEITITNARLRANIGERPSAGYFELQNHGAADKLMRAKSEAFDHIELHTHIKDGEIMRMRQMENIALGANSKTSFKPHGYHLMLFKPKTALKKGDTVEITLEFQNNPPQNVSFIIGTMGQHHKKPPMQHHHGH